MLADKVAPALSAGLLLIGLVLWALAPAPAAAIGPVCPSRIHPCACPSPCPVADLSVRASVADAVAHNQSTMAVVGEQTSIQEIGASTIMAATNSVLRLWRQAQSVLLDADALSDLFDVQSMGIGANAGAAIQDARRFATLGMESNRAVALRSYESNVQLGFEDKERIRDYRSEQHRSAALSALSEAYYVQAMIAMETDRAVQQLSVLIEDFDRSDLSIADSWARASASARAIDRITVSQSRLLASLLEFDAIEKIGADPALFVSTTASAATATVVSPAASPTSDLVAAVRAYIRDVEYVSAYRHSLSYLSEISDTVRSLDVVREQHEARKRHSYATETDLRAMADELYIDGAAAAEQLLSELAERNTREYTDADRYRISYDAALSLAPEFMAETASTRFGERRPASGACYENAMGEGSRYCPEYTILSSRHTSPTEAEGSAVSQVDDYYRASHDRFHSEAVTYDDRESLIRRGARADALNALGYTMQYRQEAERRREYWQKLRRGPDGMAPELRGQIARNRPDCFQGPVQATPEAIFARPELFDYANTCDLTVWPAGPNEGRRINALQLDGVDAGYLVVRHTEENHAQRFQTDPDAVLERIQAFDMERMIELTSAAGLTSLQMTLLKANRTLANALSEN